MVVFAILFSASAVNILSAQNTQKGKITFSVKKVFSIVKGEFEKFEKFDVGGGFIGFLVGDKVTIDLSLPF